MKQKNKSRWIALLRYVPFAVCIVFMALYLFSGEEITAETLRDYAPGNMLLAG